MRLQSGYLKHYLKVWMTFLLGWYDNWIDYKLAPFLKKHVYGRKKRGGD
jgi:hypothetical protein